MEKINVPFKSGGFEPKVEETKKCAKCDEIKPISKFHKRITNGNISYRNECFTCRGKKERAKLKLDMIIALGGKCECCGENHPYFLSLDHRNNDGPSHRENYNEQQIYRIARQENFDKTKWQLLCMNCNFAKGHFKECPHRLGITAQQAYKTLENTASGIGFGLVQHKNQFIKTPEQKFAEAASILGITVEQLQVLACKLSI